MTAGAASPRPVPGAARPYHFPAFRSIRLDNGVEVVVAPVKRLPLATIRMVVDAGARAEAPAEAGVAALTAACLAEGTERTAAAALAGEFERLGGSLSTSASWDAAQAATTVMVDRLEPALQLLAEVIRTPALAPREVERLRAERLAELLELRTEPRGLADERFATMLYQATSRLSLPEAGSDESVAALTAEKCRSWHQGRFMPAATTVIICGDIDIQQVGDMAAAVLGDWHGASPPAAVVDDAAASRETRLQVIHRAAAPQTELRLGHVGLRRNHPDYFDVVVMNAILGGVFNSRINLNLRERHAFTYGAFSSFEWRRDAGAFTVSTAVATDVTGAAVREVVGELERMRSGPPTDAELSLCTSYLEGVFPIRFETTDAIAGALASLRVFGLPDNYFDTYRERIRAVTGERVAEVARTHLHTDRLQVLAVGDRESIQPQLAGLGLGEVEELSAT